MAGTKKYIALYNRIVEDIRTGKHHVNDKLPTESELAAKHGLSRQTVRESLNKLEREGLIDKVQGSGSYVSESAFTKKQSMRIAVITTYISTYIFPSILRGFEEVLSQNQYSMVLSATNNSISKERDILQNLGAVDGILVEGTKTALPNPNLKFYRALLQKNVPLVFFDGYYPDLITNESSQALFVVTDDYQGGYDLTNELVKMGHTAVAGIFKSDDMQGIQRFSGYLDALTNNNVPIRDSYICWFNTETKSDIERHLLESNFLDGCTAVVCYNDEIAQQVFSVLKTKNTAISAIYSIDGILSNPHDQIAFKSLPHPQEDLGRLAAHKLINIIKGCKENNSTLPFTVKDDGNL